MMTEPENPNWPATTIARSAYLRGRIGWQGLKAAEFVKEGPFLVTGTDFTDGRIDWDACYHVSESRYAEADYIHLKNDDVLITKDGTIGKVALVEDCPEKAVLNSGIFLLRCNDGSFQHRYMFHLLRSDIFRKFLDDNLAGSTIQHLYQHVFKTFEFAIPKPLEQTKIAEILSTIDSAVEQTEALIAKQQRIKTGLIQQFLARGIDQHGETRRLRTHRFKDSILGSIPAEWRVGSLLDVTDTKRQPILTGPFGADLGADDFVEEGVPVLRIGNVQQGRLDLNNLLFVSPEKAQELNRYVIKFGDLLFARQGATTGRNALADENADGCLINYHIIRVALDHDLCAPGFIEAMFDSELVKSQIDREKGRGTREGINTAQLRALRLKLPPVDEQRVIAGILCQVEMQSTQTTAFATNLSRVKTALMQDLLTERKRVTPLLEQGVTQ
jgi:type I restriction enzyme S subunit